MKQPLILGVVGALVLVPGVAAGAAQGAGSAPNQAESRARETMTDGWMVSLTGDKLVVAVGKHRRRFVVRVTKKTMCGYARGNRGTGIPCRQLGRQKYRNKLVRMTWSSDAKKRRVANSAYVILSR